MANKAYGSKLCMNIDVSSSVGIFPVLYIILQNFAIVLTLRSSRVFNISVDISSDPVALPLFIEFIAFCTSFCNMLFQVVIANLGISVLLSSYNSVICSFHLLATSSSSKRRFPALSITGVGYK